MTVGKNVKFLETFAASLTTESDRKLRDLRKSNLDSTLSWERWLVDVCATFVKTPTSILRFRRRYVFSTCLLGCNCTQEKIANYTRFFSVRGVKIYFKRTNEIIQYICQCTSTFSKYVLTQSLINDHFDHWLIAIKTGLAMRNLLLHVAWLHWLPFCLKRKISETLHTIALTIAAWCVDATT